jgi:transcriptional regulator with XRE-family HTH domain
VYAILIDLDQVFATDRQIIHLLSRNVNRELPISQKGLKMLVMENNLQGWLLKKFLQWQVDTGERNTLEQFSEYLGIGRSTLSKWMNGSSRPGPELIDQISDKLGPEVYDIVGVPRPDPDLIYIIKRWPALTEEQRRAVKDQAARYASDHRSATIAADVAPPKPRKSSRAASGG